MEGCLGRGCEYSGPNRAGNFLSSSMTTAFSRRIQFCGMCVPSNFRFTYFRWGIIEITCTWCFVFFTAVFDTNFIQLFERINKYAYLLLLVKPPIQIQWEIIWFLSPSLWLPYHLCFSQRLKVNCTFCRSWKVPFTFIATIITVNQVTCLHFKWHSFELPSV